MPGRPKRAEDLKQVAKKNGRPTAFRQEYCEQAYKLCLLGATDEKLADFFNVSKQTVNVWKKAHPKFHEALKTGKEAADAEIAAALFHRAKGYSHPEDDIRTVSTGQGNSEIVITPTIKHYPPDTQAATWWLKNRQPEAWRDKQEIEHVHMTGLHLNALRHRALPNQQPELIEDVTPKTGGKVKKGMEEGEGGEVS